MAYNRVLLAHCFLQTFMTFLPLGSWLRQPPSRRRQDVRLYSDVLACLVTRVVNLFGDGETVPAVEGRPPRLLLGEVAQLAELHCHTHVELSAAVAPTKGCQRTFQIRLHGCACHVVSLHTPPACHTSHSVHSNALSAKPFFVELKAAIVPRAKIGRPAMSAGQLLVVAVKRQLRSRCSWGRHRWFRHR